MGILAVVGIMITLGILAASKQLTIELLDTLMTILRILLAGNN